MELLHQIFPTWYIYLDVFLLGVGLYAYLGKIQAGDGDKIKGFPLVKEAYFADIISNNFAEKNAPKPTIA